MKTKLSPAAVGMFVLGALLIGVVAFLSFGGTNFFSKQTRFLVYFNESVSGLDPGAAVKVNGVRVGRVAAINVRYDPTKKVSLVRVTCAIDRNILTDADGKPIDLSSPAELQTLIDRGMRARLSLTGITGLLFVDLSFEDAAKFPADARFMNEQFPVVPSIPSPISEVQANIVEIVASIKKVDFPALSDQLKTLMATTNRKVSDLDVKALAERIGRAADAVTGFVNSPDAKQAFANLNGAITDARTLMARLDGKVDPVSNDLRKTLADAQAAMQSLNAVATTTRNFVRDQGQVGDELTLALRQVADAASALQRLADELARNPSSLIVGKKKRE